MQIGWLEILKVRSSQGCVSSRLVLDRLQVGARIWVLWRPGSVGPGRHSDRAQHGAQRSKEAQVGSPASEGMAGVAIEEEGGFLEHVSLFPALASNKMCGSFRNHRKWLLRVRWFVQGGYSKKPVLSIWLLR